MEKGREEYWKQHGIKYAKRAHDEAYFAGFHHGRHKQREQYVQSGWLILDPSKIDEIKYAAENPCEGCKNRVDYLKIGCKEDPTRCDLKQKQMLAIELLTYFGR